MKRRALACFSATAWMAPMLASVPVAAQTIDHAAPSASAESSAEQVYRDALALHAAGDLRGALRAMQESYRLSRRAELLYNIARIEAELGDCPASLADYRRYLELVPQGQYRADAEDASRRLDAECPEASTSPDAAPVSSPVAAGAMLASQGAPPAAPATPASDTQPAPAAADPPSYWTTPRILGWSALAAGTLAGAGAVYFTLSAHDAHDRFQSSVDAAATGAEIDYTIRDEMERDQRWAWTLGVTGGALLVTGALVLILTPASPAGNTTIAHLYLQPDLVGATFAGRF